MAEPTRLNPLTPPTAVALISVEIIEEDKPIGVLLKNSVSLSTETLNSQLVQWVESLPGVSKAH